MVIKVGAPYPDARYKNTEGAVIANNEQNFDILIVMQGITEPERKAFAKGKMRYGIFTEGGIPFFLLSFPDAQFTCDAPMNFHKLHTENRAEWLQSDANAINVISIEKRNYNVLSIRFCGLEPSVIKEFKASAETQLARYTTKEDVDRAINIILNRFTTEQMIGKAKMYTL
jgi:hypothetical protein